MSWTQVSWSTAPEQPWKNGGGITRELLAWPNTQHWRVRISVADIVLDGPFSHFDGVQRWFAVLSGAGAVLDVDGRSVLLCAGGDAFNFDGAASTHCKLIDGHTQDINLMLRGASGRMTRVRDALTTGAVTPNPSAKYAKLIATYSIDSATKVTFDGENTVLPPKTLAWRVISQPGMLTVASANAIWMEIDL